jgi:hypothetical protein
MEVDLVDLNLKNGYSLYKLFSLNLYKSFTAANSFNLIIFLKCNDCPCPHHAKPKMCEFYYLITRRAEFHGLAPGYLLPIIQSEYIRWEMQVLHIRRGSSALCDRDNKNQVKLTPIQIPPPDPVQVDEGLLVVVAVVVELALPDVLCAHSNDEPLGAVQVE